MYRSSIVFLSLITATAPAAAPQDTAILARAEQLQLEFRQGNLAVADPLVKSLEAAVAKSPDNSKLREALGNAYMSQLATLSNAADSAAQAAVAERARDSFARALRDDGYNALLLASHGMAGMLASMLKGEHAAMQASIDEMNAAVRKAPKSTLVRLTRGFTIIHLPPGVRDDAAVTEDLEFILGTAPGGRAEDVLHVLLGDLYAEKGKLAEARGEYQLVAGASAFAKEQVRVRMDELAQGRISPASIGMARGAAGARCVTCHAPGTDH